MKKRQITLLMAIAIIVMFSFSMSFAQQMFIYPNKGQSPDQQSGDEFECQRWAKNQTGVDPHQLAQQQTHAPQARRGQVFGGAARGAALGVIGGAISGRGRAKKGAAIGAGVGAAGGYMNKRQQEQQQAQYHEQANRHRRDLMNTYNRAYRACLEGRGYTIR